MRACVREECAYVPDIQQHDDEEKHPEEPVHYDAIPIAASLLRYKREKCVYMCAYVCVEYESGT